MPESHRNELAAGNDRMLICMEIPASAFAGTGSKDRRNDIDKGVHAWAETNPTLQQWVRDGRMDRQIGEFTRIPVTCVVDLGLLG